MQRTNRRGENISYTWNNQINLHKLSNIGKNNMKCLAHDMEELGHGVGAEMSRTSRMYLCGTALYMRAC